MKPIKITKECNGVWLKYCFINKIKQFYPTKEKKEKIDYSTIPLTDVDMRLYKSILNMSRYDEVEFSLEIAEACIMCSSVICKKAMCKLIAHGYIKKLSKAIRTGDTVQPPRYKILK